MFAWLMTLLAAFCALKVVRAGSAERILLVPGLTPHERPRMRVVDRAELPLPDD